MDTTVISRRIPSRFFLIRLVVVAGIVWGGSACGSYLGVSSQLPLLDHDTAVVGPEIGYRAYAMDSQGFIWGGSSSLLNKAEDSCCYQFRARADLGYGICPLLHTSPLGFEATIGPTIGNVAVDDNGHFAVGGTAALAAPIRVNRSKDLWRQNAISEAIWMVVPKAGFEMLVPTGSVDHRPLTGFELSLNVRFMIWPTIIP